MDELLTALEERARLTASLVQALRTDNLRLRQELAVERTRASDLEQRIHAAAQRIQSLLDASPTDHLSDDPKIPSSTS